MRGRYDLWEKRDSRLFDISIILLEISGTGNMFENPGKKGVPMSLKKKAKKVCKKVIKGGKKTITAAKTVGEVAGAVVLLPVVMPFIVKEAVDDWWTDICHVTKSREFLYLAVKQQLWILSKLLSCFLHMWLYILIIIIREAISHFPNEFTYPVLTGNVYQNASLNWEALLLYHFMGRRKWN